MLYIDVPFEIPKDHPTAPRCFKGRWATHLMADSEAELIAYAESLGMRESWIQDRRTPLVHFDLTGSKMAKALADPAVKKMALREMVVMFRNRKNAEEIPDARR